MVDRAHPRSMAVTRLSDSQKTELVVRFRAGEGSQALANAYGCSAATITRTVRAALDPAEYERLKQSGGRRGGAPSSGDAPSAEALALTHTQPELAYPESELAYQEPELAFPESRSTAREVPLPPLDLEEAGGAPEADLAHPAPGNLALADADDFATDNFANVSLASDDEDMPGEDEGEGGDENDEIVEANDIVEVNDIVEADDIVGEADGDDDITNDDDLNGEDDDLDDEDDEFADIDDEDDLSDEDELSDEDDDSDDDDSDDEEADIGVIRPRGTRRHHAADALAALGTAARTGQPVETLPLEEASLPASAYMLVDKTVELQARPLSEFPELGLLEAEELERQALVVFGNPRQAKRQCGRSQRVIKIPDTSVFVRTSRFLVSQGISRVVIEGALYSLPGS